MPPFSLRPVVLALVLAAFAPVAVPARTIDVLQQQVLTDNTNLRQALDAVGTGDTDRARTLVMGVLVLAPDLAPAHEVLGVIEAAEGAYDAAIAAFSRAIELNPEQATALTKLGDVHLALGDRSTARGHFQRALAILPDDRLTHQRLGLLAEEDGDIAAAIHHFEAGLSGTPPDYLGIKINLALLYNTIGGHSRALELLAPFTEGERPALFHRALANAHLGLGDTAAAIEQYRAALTRVAGDTAAQFGLGVALTASGDAEGAIAALAPLHGATPSDPEVAIALARAHAAAGDTAAGLATLAAAIPAEGPTAPELLAEAAGLHTAEGDIEAAEARWIALRTQHPEAVAGHLGHGALLGFQRRYDEAAEVLAAGLALSPNHPGLLRAAARAAQHRNRSREALTLATRLAASDAAQPQDLFLKATLEEAAGAPEAATATYRALIAAAPEFWPALNNLAVLLTEAGQTAEAVELAEAARAHAPDSAPVAHTLGWAHLRAGDAASAEPLLAEAVDLAPENAPYLAHLAEAEFALGRAEDARTTLERARAAGLNASIAAELATRIGG